VRILYHHRLGSKDGQCVHVGEIVTALRRLGHDVVVVGPGMTDGTKFGGEVGLIATLKRRLPKAAYEGLELGYGMLAAGRLAREARTHGAEMIYERYNLHLSAGASVARRLRLPFLLEVNAPLAHERAAFGGLGLPRLARWSESRVWRAADAVFTVTNELADMIVAAGVPRARVYVRPNGVDTDRFEGLLAPELAKAALGLGGKRVVGFVGFVREWHGLDRMVDWLAERAPEDVILCLVGDGPARGALESRARTKGVGARFHVTGIVGRQDLPTWLTAFDIALQPDVVPYASPLKLVEYMAAGLAIVAPDRPNIREILTDKVEALLVAPPKVPDAVERLLADACLRSRLGAAARAAVPARGLTWEANARQIATVADRLRQQAAARSGGAGTLGTDKSVAGPNGFA
jgi:glycosyltransferase involved in cell wall biosynthesis